MCTESHKDTVAPKWWLEGDLYDRLVEATDQLRKIDKIAPTVLASKHEWVIEYWTAEANLWLERSEEIEGALLESEAQNGI